MAVEIQGKVGPVYASDGSIIDPRLTHDGAMSTGDLHGRYNEAALRGGVWTLATAVAGITLATANTIAQSGPSPIVGVFNPVASGKVLAIIRVSAQWLSGTPPTAGLVFAVLPPNAGVTAAGGNGAINPYTFVTGGSTAKTFTNSAMTGSGTAALLRYVGGPFGATLAAGASVFYTEETAGEIIVPAGGAFALLASGAGTTAVLCASMTWEEYTP